MLTITKEHLGQSSSETGSKDFERRCTWAEPNEVKPSWNSEEEAGVGQPEELAEKLQLVLHRIKLDVTKEETIRKHIDIDRRVLSGVPIIKGTRIPIYLVLGYISEGYSFSEIRAAFPSLTSDEQIKAALLFASEMCYSTME